MMTNGTTPPQILTWRQEYETIYNDVVDLHHKRHIFRDTMAIIERNPALRAEGGYVFENWLVENYAVTLAVGIRRQGDRASDVISTAKLIADIENNATVITRDWFVNEYLVNAPANDKAFWKHAANEDFDKFAPDGAASPSVSLIRADQDRLQSVVGRVRHFVNKRLAHYSTKGYQGPVTFKEVHEALDELGVLLQRYSLLLKQSGLLAAEPIIVEDWRAVLRVPWIT